MSGQIFISYRREESRWSARSLHDRLCQDFDRKQIFMDIDAIALGEDFVEAIETTVAKCDVLVAVIGNNWLASKDDHGDRRLENPEDFVRMEIATALKRKIRVIPVLVDGALMPRPTDLPEDLKPLVRRNALRITDTSFDGDCQRLVTAIKQVLEKAATEELERLEAEQRQRGEEERLEAEQRQREEKERLEAEQRQRGEEEWLEAEQRQREEKERLAAERRSEESLKLLRWGGEKRQLEEKERGEPSVENAPNNADGLFGWMSKYHFLFPVCAVLGYIFAASYSGHIDSFDTKHYYNYLPLIPILIGLTDHLAQRRWTIFEIIAYWIGAVIYGGLVVCQSDQFWVNSGGTHYPNGAIILAFWFQFSYAILATICARRQRRLKADRPDQRFRLLQKWSFVPFALMPVIWLLPVNERENFYQNAWDNAVRSDWLAISVTLLVLSSPLVLLFLHFVSLRWKIYLDAIISWVGGQDSQCISCI
ncbi:MAG TPA: TIR domain-containing protein [Chthoniobacterales bacterium]|nr:TIR domain-containing protein [Chthoniobacterales bacterium]